MEYLVVHYDRKRTVYVNGEKSGFTNKTCRLNAGIHKVDLGEPVNNKPRRRRIDIHGTTPLQPMEIKFEG